MIKNPQVVVTPMPPLTGVILLQLFMDLIETYMLVKSSFMTKIMLLVIHGSKYKKIDVSTSFQ